MGALKMMENVKMQVVKMTDQVTRREIRRSERTMVSHFDVLYFQSTPVNPVTNT